jgi:hypothetical protein
MNDEFDSKLRHAFRSLLKGDIKQAMQIRPASANSFATSPEMQQSTVHDLKVTR